jgi:small conductance mechanosensitive channel
MKTIIDTGYLEKYATSFTTALIDYSPKLIAALLLLVIGIWGIKTINTLARKIMIKREIEPTLIEFLSDTLFWGLRIVLFIAVISKLGIESSSFVAILGAAGLAIGLSLQGSLANFAGGMLIILFKPFKLGDTIEAQASFGKVIDIQIFVTQILTPNNQIIFIPNGILSNGKIINYSKEDKRRTDIIISIPYSADLKEAKEKLSLIVSKNSKIFEHPAPLITVQELTEVSVKLSVKVWTKNSDYLLVCSSILEQYKTAIDQQTT